MRAGTMRHNLIIEKQTSTQDDTGQPRNEWLPKGSVRAAIVPMNGREVTELGKQIGEITHRIFTRYHDEIGQDCRLVEGTTTYEIVQLLNKDMRNRELELTCKERTT